MGFPYRWAPVVRFDAKAKSLSFAIAQDDKKCTLISPSVELLMFAIEGILAPFRLTGKIGMRMFMRARIAGPSLRTSAEPARREA